MVEQLRLDIGHTELPIILDNFDGSLRSLFSAARFYMVGKIVRQDRESYARDNLICNCHKEVVKVFGPSNTDIYYKAYCAVDGEELAREKNMAELWSVVTSLQT
jgi:hypothetical protein